MGWHKLKQMDDWGSISVHIGAPSLSSYGTWSRKNGDTPELRKGDYKVQWPDGSEETLEVAMFPYKDQVGDMGHYNWVYGQKPYFKIQHKGATQYVYAPDLGVMVWRD